jgi:cell division transport system ATP-binding protein
VVHQDGQFLDHLPLAANVMLPLTVSGPRGNARGSDDLLAWVGLKHLADALPPRCRAANGSARRWPARSSWGPT